MKALYLLGAETNNNILSIEEHINIKSVILKLLLRYYFTFNPSMYNGSYNILLIYFKYYFITDKNNLCEFIVY